MRKNLSDQLNKEKGFCHRTRLAYFKKLKFKDAEFWHGRETAFRDVIKLLERNADHA